MLRGLGNATGDHSLNLDFNPASPSIAVAFFVRMVRVQCGGSCPAILYVHSDARGAGFGSLSRLFDLSTFGGMRLVVLCDGRSRTPAASVHADWQGPSPRLALFLHLDDFLIIPFAANDRTRKRFDFLNNWPHSCVLVCREVVVRSAGSKRSAS